MISPVEDATKPRPFVTAAISAAIMVKRLREEGHLPIHEDAQNMIYEEMERAIRYAITEDRKVRIDAE